MPDCQEECFVTAGNVLLNKCLFRATDNSTSRLPPLWIGCVLTLGTVLSLTLFVAVRGWEQREREAMTTGLVREQVEKLQVTMLRSMEVLYSIASLHQAHGNIEREQFSRFVRQALDRQPELQALSWNPLVPATRRAEFEQAAAASGMDEFEFREQVAPGRLVPERTRPDYVPVYFIEPLERNAAALGFDLNSDPVRRESVEQARDTGKAVATAPIRLAQEFNNQAGIVVLLPVYRGATPTNVVERRERLEGYAVAVFRVADLVATAFQDLKVRGVETCLFDQSPAGEKLYSSAKADDTSRSTTGRPAWLEVASRRWAVVFAPTAEFKN